MFLAKIAFYAVVDLPDVLIMLILTVSVYGVWRLRNHMIENEINLENEEFESEFKQAILHVFIHDLIL